MLKKRLQFIFFTSLTIFSLFSQLLLRPLQAAGTREELENQLESAGARSWGETSESAAGNLAVIIRYAVSAFLGLLGIIFLVLILYAGFNWMTAGGSEEKVTTAKQTLIRATIGLIIIVAAYGITYFIFSSLPDGGGSGGMAL